MSQNNIFKTYLGKRSNSEKNMSLNVALNFFVGIGSGPVPSALIMTRPLLSSSSVAVQFSKAPPGRKSCHISFCLENDIWLYSHLDKSSLDKGPFVGTSWYGLMVVLGGMLR